MLTVGRSEIEAVIDIVSMASDIEAAYVAASAGEVEIPPVGHITFPDVDGDCHIKYGHRRADADFVIKVATGFHTPMRKFGSVVMLVPLFGRLSYRYHR